MSIWMNIYIAVLWAADALFNTDSNSSDNNTNAILSLLHIIFIECNFCKMMKCNAPSLYYLCDHILLILYFYIINVENDLLSQTFSHTHYKINEKITFFVSLIMITSVKYIDDCCLHINI